MEYIWKILVLITIPLACAQSLISGPTQPIAAQFRQDGAISAARAGPAGTDVWVGQLTGLGLRSFIEQVCDDNEPCCKALKEMEPTLFDSWGKPPSGVLTSAWKWMGDYDQCVSYTPRDYETQYCIIDQIQGIGQVLPSFFQNSSSPNITYGICLPANNSTVQCNASDIQHLLQQVLRLLFPSTNGTASMLLVGKLDCIDSKASKNWSASTIVVICVYCVFACLVVIGTTYDVIRRITGAPVPADVSQSFTNSQQTHGFTGDNERQGLITGRTTTSSYLLNEVLVCFSFYTNILRCFKLSSRNSQHTNLHCIHGIRVLSMLYIVYGHTFYYCHMYFKQDVSQVLTRIEHGFMFQVIFGGSLAVDSFFLLSGLLLSYIFYFTLQRQSDFSIRTFGIMVIHRLWRLTPAYMMLLVFYGSIFPLFGNGPWWKENTRDCQPCQHLWWHNILYINNLFKSQRHGEENEFCMGWSWYMGNDMQFFIVSPIFVLALYRKPVLGLLLTVGAAVASCTAATVISAVNRFPAAFQGLDAAGHLHDDVNRKYMDALYYVPWMRIPPYLVGILVGFLLTKITPGFRLPKVVYVAGWLISIMVLLLLLFGLQHVSATHHQLNYVASAFYNGFSRMSWTAALGWVIVACVGGYGGVINKFLSLPIFEALGNLTYMMYLIHPMIIHYYFGRLREPLIFNYSTLISLFFGVTVYGYFVSFIAYITLEYSFIAIEKVVKGQIMSYRNSRNSTTQ